jgi:hypothetical protein
MQPAKKSCDWLHTYRGFTLFKPQKISRCAQLF